MLHRCSPLEQTLREQGQTGPEALNEALRRCEAGEMDQDVKMQAPPILRFGYAIKSINVAKDTFHSARSRRWRRGTGATEQLRQEQRDVEVKGLRRRHGVTGDQHR